MNALSALSSTMSNIDFSSRQGYAVAKLALDQAKVDGAAAVKLIDSAAAVGTRPSRDTTSSCSGTNAYGGTIDTYA